MVSKVALVNGTLLCIRHRCSAKSSHVVTHVSARKSRQRSQLRRGFKSKEKQTIIADKCDSSFRFAVPKSFPHINSFDRSSVGLEVIVTIGLGRLAMDSWIELVQDRADNRRTDRFQLLLSPSYLVPLGASGTDDQ